jgi:hypothetical protein
VLEKSKRSSNLVQFMYCPKRGSVSAKNKEGKVGKATSLPPSQTHRQSYPQNGMLSRANNRKYYIAILSSNVSQTTPHKTIGKTKLYNIRTELFLERFLAMHFY